MTVYKKMGQYVKGFLKVNNGRLGPGGTSPREPVFTLPGIMKTSC